MANAIKVFYHLKTLEQKLDTTLTALNAKISQTTKNVLSEDVQREGTQPTEPVCLLRHVTVKLRTTKRINAPLLVAQLNHRRTASGASNMAKWRAALWTRIERLTDVLHSCSVRFAIFLVGH